MISPTEWAWRQPVETPEAMIVLLWLARFVEVNRERERPQGQEVAGMVRGILMETPLSSPDVWKAIGELSNAGLLTIGASVTMKWQVEP